MSLSVTIDLCQCAAKKLIQSDMHHNLHSICCLLFHKNSLLLVLTILSQLWLVENVSYNVSPLSSDGSCSASNNSGSCSSLSEVAASVISNKSVLNISLILAPGNHTLHSKLTIIGRTIFWMKSEDSQQPAVINCGLSSRLQVQFSTYVHIQDIILNGCVENEVKSVDRLTIENCILSARGTPNSVPGRALAISNSAMAILGSRIEYFTSLKPKPSGQGGAILSVQSDMLISGSTFFMNQAGKGGVMYCIGSTVLISNTVFTKNNAVQGGVLYIQNGNTMLANRSSGLFHDYETQSDTYNITMLTKDSVSCVDSNFTMNWASKEGGVIYSNGGKNSMCTLYLYRNNFNLNNASSGAAFEVKYSSTEIRKSNFLHNRANKIGGVGLCHYSTLLIYQSTFCYNQAGIYAGALSFNNFTNATISSGSFHKNKADKMAGCLSVRRKSHVLLTGIIFFEQNLVQHHNAAISVYDSSSIRSDPGSLLHFTNNSGSITIVHSTGNFAGCTLLKDNEGSVHFYDSTVEISGHLTSLTVQQTNHNRTWEGGCITLFLSTVVISGRVTLKDSVAVNGGGMLSISSSIVVDVSGKLIVMNNIASDTGGGIYFYHSELRAQGLVLVDSNKASKFGGGIHCITSTIVLIHNQQSQYLKLSNNEAAYGGGICLEASSKYYIKHLSGTSKQVVIYTSLMIRPAMEGQSMLLTILPLAHVPAANCEQSLHLYSPNVSFNF